MSKQTSNFNEKARSIRLKNRTGTGECSMSEKAKNEVYRLKTDGFHGELFRPEQDSYPGKALICFSGSDGRFEWSRTLAQIFQSHGLTALALASMNTVCQGFSEERGITVMPGSAWSLHGEEVPYTPFGLDKFPMGQVVWKSLKAREVTMYDLYIPLESV